MNFSLIPPNPNPDFDYQPPHAPFICIVHKDDDLLVLSKPSGLLSVPGRKAEHSDCLETRAKNIFTEALLTHRLDRGTSGLMVMAMNRRAQSILGRHFENRLIQKTYIACVAGHVQDDEGLIDLPLRCDWPNRPRQIICYQHGKPSQTKWRVLKRKEISGQTVSIIELKPLTGRSHQLRVHMLSLGHPILGDELYAPELAKSISPRLMLHAYRLTLHHPKDGKIISFQDPCTMLESLCSEEIFIL